MGLVPNQKQSTDPSQQTQEIGIKNDTDAKVFISKRRLNAAKKLIENLLTQEMFQKTFKEQELSLTHIKQIEPLVDILWQKSNFKPYKYDDINQKLIDAEISIIYKEGSDPELKDILMQACVSKVSATYEIFINEDCEAESFYSTDLHEKGHIFFSHLENLEIYLQQFTKEVIRLWDEKLAKWFTEDCIAGHKRKNIIKMLFNMFSNIAKDMEINSKLFENEWMEVKRTMSRSYLVMRFSHLKEYFDDLSKSIKDPANKINTSGYEKIIQEFSSICTSLFLRADGKVDDILFCYPTYHNWPEKLDWMSYMTLLLKNIDETMEQIKDQLQQMAGLIGGGQNGDKQISKEVVDKYFEDQQTVENKMKGEDDLSTTDNEDDDEENPSNSRSTGNNSRGTKGTGAWKDLVSTCETFDAFTKLLNKLCLGKKNRRIDTNLLYYANRKKISSSVVVPRRHTTERWVPTNVTIVVDVSGSVKTDYVERVINAIKDANTGIDLKSSRIIFCDTKVVSDESLGQREKYVYSGGGTNIAVGISYALEKYVHKQTDKLFVISDFCDDLIEWQQAAQGRPGIKYAIGYNVNNSDDFDGRDQMSDYFPQNENGIAFCKTFNVLFINAKIS